MASQVETIPWVHYRIGLLRLCFYRKNLCAATAVSTNFSERFEPIFQRDIGLVRSFLGQQDVISVKDK
jgi:hypothetical protein